MKYETGNYIIKWKTNEIVKGYLEVRVEVEVVMLSSCIRRNAIIGLPLLVFVGHTGAKDSHKKKFTPLIPAKSLSVYS